MAAASVTKEAGVQTLGTYIDRRKETVVDWVILRLLLEVCDREMGYEGGGRRHELLCRQKTDRKHLRARSEEILAAERA